MNSLDPPYVANQGTVNGYDRRKSNYYSNTVTYRFDKLTLTNASSYQESLPGGFGVGLGLGPPLGVGTLVNGGKCAQLRQRVQAQLRRRQSPSTGSRARSIRTPRASTRSG